jgi:NAD(P)-dependent dehydrogenase (short-subunit alcohol dehydrogenase family)
MYKKGVKMSKKILITGTSSGFGNLIASTLLKREHTVIASMREINGKNREAAEKLKTKGAHIVEIDVTSDKSVEEGVQEAIELAGGLDAVVNNAGIGVIGMQEFFTPDDWKNLFDVNVFGVQRVNRAAIPHLRENNSGLLIHISSLLGRFALPFYGPYNSSKWALEALAENYRVELSEFGIESCIVEPGGFPTNFLHGLMKPTDSSRKESYGEYAKLPMEMFVNFEKTFSSVPEQNPQLVADAVANLVDAPAGERKFRTVVDKMGMGDHFNGYNESLEQITSGIYSAFGMVDMLKPKVKELQ